MMAYLLPLATEPHCAAERAGEDVGRARAVEATDEADRNAVGIPAGHGVARESRRLVPPLSAGEGGIVEVDDGAVEDAAERRLAHAQAVRGVPRMLCGFERLKAVVGVDAANRLGGREVGL